AATASFAPRANGQGEPQYDYYSPLGHQRLQVVELFHRGLDKQRLRERKFEIAYNEFNFILVQFPNHPEALLLMAQTCDQWMAVDACQRCTLDDGFDRAIAINPTHAGTFVAQGIYLHRQKQYAKAIESFSRAIALD